MSWVESSACNGFAHCSLPFGVLLCMCFNSPTADLAPKGDIERKRQQDRERQGQRQGQPRDRDRVRQRVRDKE